MDNSHTETNKWTLIFVGERVFVKDTSWHSKGQKTFIISLIKLTKFHSFGLNWSKLLKCSLTYKGSNNLIFIFDQERSKNKRVDIRIRTN